MDASSSRPAAPVGQASVEQADWRIQLSADSRRRIVDKISETIKRQLPYSSPEGLQSLKEMAEHIEKRIYDAASSQPDYVQKISLEMLSMENKYQNTIRNTMPGNAASNSNRLPGTTASQSLPSQAQNQPQSHQQLVSQYVKNNMAPDPEFYGLGTSLACASRETQSPMANVVGLNGNVQNMLSISQASGSLLQSPSAIDQQRHLYQSQRILPYTSASLFPVPQSGHVNGGDWQEEAFQKVKQMRKNYMLELTEMYQKVAAKLQQHDTMPQQPKSDQHDKLKMFKQMVERLLHVLQTPKSNIGPSFKEKLVIYEKQIQSFLSSNGHRKPMQQGLAQPHMQNLHQQQSRVSQVQSHENLHMNPQMQSMTLQGSVLTIPPDSMSSLHHNSLPSISGLSALQRNMMNPLQTGSNMDSRQGNSLGSLQQVAVGSLQKNSASSSQQPSISSLPTQSRVSMLQPNIPERSNSSMLQHQHLKQQEQQQLAQSQHLKQQFQQPMQLHHQSRQQLPAQMQAPGGVQTSRQQPHAQNSQYLGQVQNQPQAHRQLVSQNVQNNRAPCGVQSLNGPNISLPSTSGMTQRPITNVFGQGNMQNKRSICQASNGNVFSGSQKPMENVVLPQQQTQAQNSEYLFQQHQHLLKRKFQAENPSVLLLQYHILQQQQIMLQPNPLQSSQQPDHVVQESLLQKMKRQRLMGQQVNVANMQQNQLMGLQTSTSISGMQQQQTLQLNNLQNSQQLQFQLQQELQQRQQQQLEQQQQFQQQQLLRSQSGNSGLRTNQYSVHMLQQPMVPIQQQPQPGGTGFLASQGQQSQLQAPQYQLMSRMQSSNTQLQHQLVLPQQTNSVQREQQSLQGPTQATGSLDPAAQSSQVNGGDWQEEGYQKLQQMMVKYINKLGEVLAQVIAKLLEVASQQPKSDQLVKLKNDKQAARRFLKVLLTPKTRITPDFKERFVILEKQIESLLDTFGPTKPIQQGPAQPKEPMPSSGESTDCPICWSPFDKATTTKCGHMFCEKCIKAALANKKKCPTCRKKVGARDLIRVFNGTNTSIP